ncbi:hypothetical protein LDO32_10825 [Luteimonas sp. Y-2-2-4F]|nr:hypothetical protein [Luteimonas sp. Y-2-2-4F]MCD9032216.1 hypothetical protein [Luteimonas sp. Y-2-2-4F]
MDLPPLRRYADRSGRSGVAAYALLPDGLLVRFVDGGLYLYDAVRPGARHVAQMRRLAGEGEGLATYISRHVGTNYRARLVD